MDAPTEAITLGVLQDRTTGRRELSLQLTPAERRAYCALGADDRADGGSSGCR